MVHVLAAGPLTALPFAWHPLTHWLGLILETILVQAKHSVKQAFPLLSLIKATSASKAASNSAVLSLSSNACNSYGPGAGITTSMKRASTQI